MTIKRRSMLAGAAALPLLPRMAHAAGQVIIGTWGGDYGELLQQTIDRPVMGAQNIEVLQDVANAEPRRAKLLAERQSRRGSMDVTCLSDTDMYLVQSQNVLDNLAEDKLPRLPAVIPALKKPYAIPHIYSAMVILYNPDKVTTPPKSYADLWDPKYRGRVGVSDILYTYYVALATLVAGGTMADLAPGRRKVMEWRSLDVKIYPSNEATAAAMKSEEIWLTPMWLARGYLWKKSGIRLEHSVPEEGALPVVFEAGVPKNARNKDNAWTYMNAMLDARAQVAFAERMGYVPTVSDAVLSDELNREINLTEAQAANLKPLDLAYMLREKDAIIDFWNKEFKG